MAKQKKPDPRQDFLDYILAYPKMKKFSDYERLTSILCAFMAEVTHKHVPAKIIADLFQRFLDAYHMVEAHGFDNCVATLQDMNAQKE